MSDKDRDRVSDRPKTPNEEVDKASADSFPASDPPSWAGGQQEDSPDIDPAAFQRERREDEYRKYDSDKRHDGR